MKTRKPATTQLQACDVVQPVEINRQIYLIKKPMMFLRWTTP